MGVHHHFSRLHTDNTYVEHIRSWLGSEVEPAAGRAGILPAFAGPAYTTSAGRPVRGRSNRQIHMDGSILGTNTRSVSLILPGHRNILEKSEAQKSYCTRKLGHFGTNFRSINLLYLEQKMRSHCSGSCFLDVLHAPRKNIRPALGRSRRPTIYVPAAGRGRRYQKFLSRYGTVRY